MARNETRARGETAATGSIPRPFRMEMIFRVLDYLRPWVDLYKVDRKGFDDRRYHELGGVLKTALDTVPDTEPETLLRAAAFLATGHSPL